MASSVVFDMAAHSKLCDEVINSQDHIIDDSAERTWLEVFAAVHRDDDPGAVGGPIVDGVATTLAIKYEADRLSNPNDFPSADEWGLGHWG